jgi:phosphoribosylpyrophosphate synthetase
MAIQEAPKEIDVVYETAKAFKLEQLEIGLRNKEDPVSWRTLVVDLRFILGAKTSPEYEKPTAAYEEAKAKVQQLVNGTSMELMAPEILYALGYGDQVEEEGEQPGLDLMVMNARQNPPDELFWTLTNLITESGQAVGSNAVGHYKDKQGRVVGVRKLFRQVDRAVIIASTQKMFGGDIDEMQNVIGLLETPGFSGRVKEVDIVIPMFGGSRGHRRGQAEEIGYEIFELKSEARKLAGNTRDILDDLERDCGIIIPKVRFMSIDLHSTELAEREFGKKGFELVNINPARELARTSCDYLMHYGLDQYARVIVASDDGAGPRTESYAIETCRLNNYRDRGVMVVYINKVRTKAGIVDSAKVIGAKIFKLEGEEIKCREVASPSGGRPIEAEVVLETCDDMLDGGNTTRTDFSVIRPLFSRQVFSMATATHPVFSSGVEIVDKLGVNLVVVGNTMNVPGLRNHPKILVADLAPAIAKKIFE